VVEKTVNMSGMLDIWHRVVCTNNCDSLGSWSQNLISPTWFNLLKTYVWTWEKTP